MRQKLFYAEKTDVMATIAAVEAKAAAWLDENPSIQVITTEFAVTPIDGGQLGKTFLVTEIIAYDALEPNVDAQVIKLIDDVGSTTFAQALWAFARAGETLLDVWKEEEIPAGAYPFGSSFDEVLDVITLWHTKVVQSAKEAKES